LRSSSASIVPLRESRQLTDARSSALLETEPEAIGTATATVHVATLSEPTRLQRQLHQFLGHNLIHTFQISDQMTGKFFIFFRHERVRLARFT
jgi:hypothetical protein